MGDLRPENGGGIPPDDGGSQPNGLPDIPPEWGPVIIPDHLGDLAEEAAAVRRELRRERRHNRIRRLFGLPPVRITGGEPAQSLAVPLFIMFTAVVITLVSLFVVTWDRSEPTGTANPGVATPPLTDLTLPDASGQPVKLGSLFPAVLLLVDDCDCGTLLADTVKAAGPGVTVIAVARRAPTVPAGVRALADGDGRLRARFVATVTPQPGTATVVMVNAAGATVGVFTGVNDIATVKPSLPALAPSPATT